MLKRFLQWMGYIPKWFTLADFERHVGRPACMRCEVANAGSDIAFLCPMDMDAWYDAVLA
jgi:hypothetical protein